MSDTPAITDILDKLRESYEGERDIADYFLEHARAFAASRIRSDLSHRLSAEDAATSGLALALKYVRKGGGDRPMNRDNFRRLLFDIVEKQVATQYERETAQLRDHRREVSMESLNLTAGELAVMDQAIARECGEKIATVLLAETDEVTRLVNLLSYFGEYSAASIHRILTSAGYSPKSIGTISNRISDCDEKAEKVLRKHLSE